jgi:hypothetical protein
MMLADAFAAYLRDRSNRSASSTLVSGLGSAGYAVEASLLKCHLSDPEGEAIVEVGGPWSGRRARFGLKPPESGVPGDLWFDPLEVVPMVLLPTADDDHGAALRSWLAIRPVANWQLSAFVELAPVSPRRQQIKAPLALLDRARLLTGRDTDSATSATLAEAGMYAHWFGKSLGGLEDWRAAYAHLSADQVEALWGRSREELGGEFEEGVGIVVRPDTVTLDYAAAYDSGTPSEVFIGEFEARPGAAFRTRILVQLGLILTTGPSVDSFADVGLDAVLSRR